MTEIYLVRHAQAEGNLYKMFQGHWDGGITKLGWKQLDDLAERFAGVQLDAVYASDLFRAMATGAAVGRSAGLKPIPVPDLREIHVGVWEGVFFADVKWTDPEMLQAFVSDPAAWQVEGSETYSIVRDRATAALIRLAEENDGRTIAAASHGVTIRSILWGILGGDLKNSAVLPIFGNTSVTHLFYENGKFTVDYMNDTSHLKADSIFPWKNSTELRAEPIDFSRDAAFYMNCYSDAWAATHAGLSGFDANAYLEAARAHQTADGHAVLVFYDRDIPAGLLDLNTRKGEGDGYGWVSFLYLTPEYRGRGCAAPVLARAIRHYDQLGRRTIRLSVNSCNEKALAFYDRLGFSERSRQRADGSTVLCLERPIREV
ncbi:MAG: bifunctional histidine phosphatase family protein/GNAT family N-acetyltransferase [Oscillospiraceae bacterium]|nr:bifunctional histidine phosphatase family protein/GNAT family N-acetyltransferase [Oscillospiraceae bacterium]